MEAAHARLVLALLVLLVTAPAAVAGTADAPEITDPADHRNPSVDLRAAWFETDANGLRFTVEVTRLSRETPDLLYWVAFEVDGEDVFAAVGFDGDAAFATYIGSPRGPQWERGGFGGAANGKAIDADYQVGEHARFTGVVPWDEVPGLEPGALVDDTQAGTTVYDRSANRWHGGVDSAHGADYVIATKPTTRGAGATGWILPLAGLGVVGVLAGGVALARRRVEPSSRPSAPRALAPRASPEEDAARQPRFRLDPRKR